MKFLRDPLVWFLAAGAVIFALDRLVFSTEDQAEIIVTDTQVQRISDQWQAQMGRAPTDTERSALVDQWIREEIYYRKALQLGLDADDTIIRRRLVQKLTFLTEDLADARPASEAELLAYYDSRPDTFSAPELFSFEHRYFSSDKRTDAERDAATALTDPAASGDPFMLQLSYSNRSERELADLFGAQFAAALTELDVSGEWQGPLRSAYGWHIVRMTARQPARVRPFSEVKEQVAMDLRQQQRKAANDALYQKLRGEFRIRYPEHDPDPAH